MHRVVPTGEERYSVNHFFLFMCLLLLSFLMLKCLKWFRRIVAHHFMKSSIYVRNILLNFCFNFIKLDDKVILSVHDMII